MSLLIKKINIFNIKNYYFFKKNSNTISKYQFKYKKQITSYIDDHTLDSLHG